MTGLTAVCLFDGVGGFPLAFTRAGIRPVLSCEIDTAARGVLTEHFDHVMHDDVRTLTADECRAAGFVPDRGVIGGGFPCQDLSVAGRRAGLSGARSGLFFEIVRLADALRPRWLVLENVPGLLSSHSGRDMGAVVGSLVELGYGIAWRVLDAQHFGVPQRRRRVVIVGCLGDGAAPVEILFEPEGVRGDSETRGAAGPDVAGTLGGGSGSRGWASDVERMTSVPFDLAQITSSENRSNPQPGDPMPPLAATGQPHIATALTTRSGATFDDQQICRLVAHTLTAGVAAKPGVNAPGRRQEDDYNIVTHTLTGEGFDASEDGTGRGTPLVPFQPIGFAWQAGGNADASGAFARDLTPTMPRNQTLAVNTATAVRRLTPTECERLQGFPDGWTAISGGRPQADSPRYRQMGNAIAVPVFEWVARRLAEADLTSADRLIRTGDRVTNPKETSS